MNNEEEQIGLFFGSRILKKIHLNYWFYLIHMSGAKGAYVPTAIEVRQVKAVLKVVQSRVSFRMWLRNG